MIDLAPIRHAIDAHSAPGVKLRLLVSPAFRQEMRRALRGRRLRKFRGATVETSTEVETWEIRVTRGTS